MAAIMHTKWIVSLKFKLVQINKIYISVQRGLPYLVLQINLWIYIIKLFLYNYIPISSKESLSFMSVYKVLTIHSKHDLYPLNSKYHRVRLTYPLQLRVDDYIRVPESMIQHYI
jgi:hypothetical protein